MRLVIDFEISKFPTEIEPLSVADYSTDWFDHVHGQSTDLMIAGGEEIGEGGAGGIISVDDQLGEEGQERCRTEGVRVASVEGVEYGVPNAGFVDSEDS